MSKKDDAAVLVAGGLGLGAAYIATRPGVLDRVKGWFAAEPSEPSPPQPAPPATPAPPSTPPPSSPPPAVPSPPPVAGATHRERIMVVPWVNYDDRVRRAEANLAALEAKAASSPRHAEAYVNAIPQAKVGLARLRAAQAHKAANPSRYVQHVWADIPDLVSFGYDFGRVKEVAPAPMSAAQQGIEPPAAPPLASSPGGPQAAEGSGHWWEDGFSKVPGLPLVIPNSEDASQGTGQTITKSVPWLIQETANKTTEGAGFVLGLFAGALDPFGKANPEKVKRDIATTEDILQGKTRLSEATTVKGWDWLFKWGG